MLTFAPLFRGSLVRITDVVCRAASDSRCGAEEHASSHHLLFTRSGVFVKHAGGRQLVAEAAHVLFFNRDEPYRVSHPVPGGDDCTVVAFGADTVADVLAAWDPSVADRPESPFSVSHGPLAAPVLLRYHGLRRAVRAGPAVEALGVEETSLDVLHGAVADAYRARGAHPQRRHRPDTARARRELAEATKLHLASCPSASPSLATLARAVSSSPFHLSRVFRHEVGMSIHKYLIRLRLALALEWLADGTADLSAVALGLGFASHSHFTDAFRKAFGITPNALRMEARA